MTLLFRPNASSGVPIYLQLKEQIRHAVEIGAILPGEPLPALRSLAEQLVVNVNTIARVYRELEQEGLVDLRHGVGAFVSEMGLGVQQATASSDRMAKARRLTTEYVDKLQRQGVSPDAIRRLVEAELDSERSTIDRPERMAARGSTASSGRRSP